MYLIQAQRDGDCLARKLCTSSLYGILAADGKTVVRQPFANNRIPASMINPAMTFLLNTMIPLPNRSGLTNNFVNTQGYANDRDAINVRGDHNFNASNTVSFRYSRQRIGQNQPGGNPYLTSVSRYDVDNHDGFMDPHI